MFHINFRDDPVLDHAYDTIRDANIRTFDDFLTRCKDADVFPEIAVLQQFEQHGRFLPELAKRGSEVAPRNDRRWSNMLENACMNLNLEGAKVAAAMGAEQGIPISENLLHVVIIFHDGRSNLQSTYDLLRYIASIRPGDLRRGKVHCPLESALCWGFLGIARLLVELGYQIDSTLMATCIERISIDSLSDANGMVDCCMYLVAMGGRVAKGFKPAGPCDRGMSVYLKALDRSIRSMDAAMVMIGLARVGGRVHGNGRDALRLVAREVWLSRMDEGWDA